MSIIASCWYLSLRQLCVSLLSSARRLSVFYTLEGKIKSLSSHALKGREDGPAELPQTAWD